MKNISVKIDSPCGENWDVMQHTSEGRYCQKCKHGVIDFSGYSKEEIIQFFNKNESGSICGSFYEDQLESLNQNEKNFFALFRSKVAAIVLLLTLKISAVTAQNNSKTAEYGVVAEPDDADTLQSDVIKGKVITQDGEEVNGLTVRSLDKNKKVIESVISDGKGNFEFKKNILEVVYIETKGKREKSRSQVVEYNSSINRFSLYQQIVITIEKEIKYKNLLGRRRTMGKVRMSRFNRLRRSLGLY